MEIAASVIVRAKDEATKIERALRSIRAQNVPTEVVLVDSGSRDATVDIARPYCDHIIEISPERFTYGHALNLGARAAGADVHVALSSHCWLPDPEWLARSLEHYARAEVAATNGALDRPDGTPLRGGTVHHQSVGDALEHPLWGFSNHASTWRATAWEAHPFNEGLAFSEDKEWALRVLRAGGTIAYASDLHVDSSHAWRMGPRRIFHRNQLGHREMGHFVDIRKPTLGDLRQDWWDDVPEDGRPAWLHRVGNWRRNAGLAGKYIGLREGARITEARAACDAVPVSPKG